MSHRVQTRQIFDLIDDRLNSGQKRQLEDHMAECKKCASYYQRVKYIRAEAAKATEPPPMDWNRIDIAVDQALKTPPKTTWSLQPILLTVAAAAAIFLALMLPHKTPKPAVQPAAVANSEPQTSTDHFLPQPVALAVVTASLIHPPHVGQKLHAGNQIINESNDGTRFSIENASIELFESSHLLIYSLNDQSPTIELKHGRLKADVPPYCFSHGLRVLAGDTSFSMMHGVVEFSFDKENQTLTVTVLEGELLSFDKKTTLGPGTWKPKPTQDQTGNNWIPIDPMTTTGGDDSFKISTREERIINRRTYGNLPKEIVHEAIKEAKPRLRTCYEKALKLDPKLSMSPSARVTISRTGSVSSVEITGLDDHKNMEDCFKKVIKELRFPHPEGGAMDFILPLRLSPLP